MSESEFNHTTDVDLKDALFGAPVMAKQMADSRDGIAIDFSSIYSIH